MYLIDAMISLFTLKWTQSTPQLRPLPPHIQRTCVSTPDGDLELLICEQSKPSASSQQPPIFFAHGGFGSAGVWIDWMTYLHDHGYSGTLYAYSVRNHGASYTLPYWQMVWQTPFETIRGDMLACLDLVAQSNENAAQPPIIVSHSGGGGLAQSLLADHQIVVSGLCLVDAMPHFGSFEVGANCWRQDPWFLLRMGFHLFHPISPFSTDALVHDIFFSRRFPRTAVKEFRRWMPNYESAGWPQGMLARNFWECIWGGKSQWLDCKEIVRSIVGDGVDKICVMVGREDVMFRPWIWERQVAEFVAALEDLKTSDIKEGKYVAYKVRDEEIPEVSISRTGAVRTVLVNGGGHHLQNEIDDAKYVAAEALLRWASQV